MKNTSLTARVIGLRVAHGTHHMPGHALLMRVAVILFGTGVSITTDSWFSVMAAAMSVLCWVVTLWELHDAAIDCEQDQGDDTDEDQGDEAETGFGRAA